MSPVSPPDKQVSGPTSPKDAEFGSSGADGGSGAERYRIMGNAIYYPSLICHFLFIFVFDGLDQSFLSAFNVASVAVITIACLAHRKGRLYWGFALYSGEIAAHAVAATVMMGWETGFFIFLTFPLMIMAFLPGARERVKLAISFGFLVLMCALVVLSYSIPALNPVGQDLRDTFLISNLVLMTVISGLFTFMFNRAIDAAEGKLVAANAHLQRFSLAVSEFLDPLLVGKLNTGGDVSPRVYPLTVLFSDLAGSTRLSREMDDGAYGAMIDEYAGTMHDTIKRHGGYVEDISGDGILAYLGNMESKGEAEDARAVVAMAIDMQRGLETLNARFAREYDLASPLQARIGISSGPGFVGKSSGVRSVYTANGASVNLGAKLEQGLKQLQDTGGILISEATRDLVGPSIRTSERQLEIGGETIPAFLVVHD